MTLESSISDLVKSSDALTDTVRKTVRDIDTRIDGRLHQVDQAVNSFVDTWGIDGVTTLEVGTGKRFTTIQDAWNSLNGKKLKADVLIKVSDGEHRYTGIHLEHQPEAHRIRIEGNPRNPAACTIKWIPDANKASHGLSIVGIHGLHLAGFRFVGEATDNNWSHRSLSLTNGSWIRCDDNTLVIEGGGNGIEINENSILYAAGVKISNHRGLAVSVNSGASAHMSRLTVTGPGKTELTHIPVHINQSAPSVRPYGVLVQDASKGWFDQSIVSNVLIGIISARNAYCSCDVSDISHVEIGFLAEHGGTLWTHFWDQGDPQKDRRSKVSHAAHGYYSQYMGYLLALGAVAEQCDTGFCSYTNAHLFANSSYARKCRVGFDADAMGSIEAYGTSAASTDCTTKYNPPNHAVLSNNCGMIRFS